MNAKQLSVVALSASLFIVSNVCGMSQAAANRALTNLELKKGAQYKLKQIANKKTIDANMFVEAMVLYNYISAELKKIRTALSPKLSAKRKRKIINKAKRADENAIAVFGNIYSAWSGAGMPGVVNVGAIKGKISAKFRKYVDAAVLEVEEWRKELQEEAKPEREKE